MQFIYPSFLWALLALAIPIIIHLFNFRRFKKVYFTNVRFLKEVKEQKSSRDKLKHLLVLLSRLAAVIFLVLAFAQPFIPRGEAEIVRGTKAVSVYLDNSFSMNALSNDVSLFEKAKRKAKEVAEAYSNEDRFQLVTNDFEGKHQRLLNKEEFMGYLDEVTITPNVRQLSEVLDRQRQAFEGVNAAQNNVFYISDFQKNIVDLENDTSLNYYFVPLQSVEQQNVFVDSVWFESPVRMLNQANKLLVRINNTGETDVENSRLTLRINEQIKALKDFSVGATQNVVDTINFTITEAGWHKAEVDITDYPINFDDNYYFTFEVAEKINVLSINQSSGTNPYLRALFAGDNVFEFKNVSVNQLDYTKLPQNQLIILNQLKDVSTGLAAELQVFVREGGSLLVFPDLQMNTVTYNNFLKGMGVNTYTEVNTVEREVDFINVKQEVFKDVFAKIPRNLDLPFARRSFDMTSYANTNEEVLMRFRGGSSALSKYNVGKGKLYLSATDLNIKNSSLPSHAVFVPMVFKVALVGTKTTQLAYTIGNNQAIEVDNKVEKKESPFKLRAKSGEFIPSQKVLGSKLLLSLSNELKEAGIYQLFLEEGQPLAHFGFNFDRTESILDYFKMDDLKNIFNFPNFSFLESEELSPELETLDRGVELWKYCILLAMAFLLIEILLLRLWK